MLGDFDLKDQIDSSHKFLYGHRFWKTVKEEIENRAENFDGQKSDLKTEIEQIAKAVSEKVKADKSLTLGISAIGLMTLNQVGFDAFKSAKGETEKPKGLMKKAPDKIVAERAKDDSQGIFGFLKTINKTFTVSWEDKQSKGKFEITNQAELATGSALDQTQDWKARDERCWEGVIPVECRSASCGTCWVGILAGEEKLSEVQTARTKTDESFRLQSAGRSETVYASGVSGKTLRKCVDCHSGVERRFREKSLRQCRIKGTRTRHDLGEETARNDCRSGQRIKIKKLLSKLKGVASEILEAAPFFCVRI